MPGLGIDIDRQLDKSNNFQQMKNDITGIRQALERLLEIEEQK